MLAKVPSPFMLPCDFAHQLGREGTRKPLQPAFRALVQVLCGSPGLRTLCFSLGWYIRL